MVWGWVHNFPTLKDVFTKPIDYPTEGYDTQIADWYQDIFDAAEAVQEYLLAGVFEDRGDPAAVDFTLANLNTDATWRELDLSSIVPTSAKGVILKIRAESTIVDSEIRFRKAGNTNAINVAPAIVRIANLYYDFDFPVALRSDRKIEYNADDYPWTQIDITVRGWWR